jgi:ribosome-binding protein aMBF1 (putative translation factor)
MPSVGDIRLQIRCKSAKLVTHKEASMESLEKTEKMDEQPKTSGGKSGGGARKSSENSRAGLSSEKYLLCKLGETIQKKRLQFGLSQEQLCVLTDMNRTYLSDIERGVSNASFLVLWKIATALKLELWEVLKDIDLSQPN